MMNSKLHVLLLVAAVFLLLMVQNDVNSFQLHPHLSVRKSTIISFPSTAPSSKVSTMITTMTKIAASTSSTINTQEVSDVSSTNVEKDIPSRNLDAVICGGGPAGLLSAIMLAQRFPSRQVHVYESNPNPPLSLNNDTFWNSIDSLERYYTLGVFGRGKNALEEFSVFEDCVKHVAQELVGNQAWRSNTTSTVYNASNAVLFESMGRESIYALPREKLVSALYEHIQKHYQSRIQFHFGQLITPIDFEYYSTRTEDGNDDSNNSVLLEIVDATTSSNGTEVITTDFLIGADGAARTVANKMEEVERDEWNFMKRLTIGRPFRVKRFVDTNPRVYKTIPVQLPSNWRKDIGYSASNGDRKYSIVSLPSNTNGGLCAVLLMKKGDPLAQADTNPQELRDALDQNVPIFSQLVDDDVIAAVAKKPVSTFPFFRYAGPRLHKGDRTVILGDACHSVKPYNGLGVNSAFEDVKILSDIILQEQSKQSTTEKKDDNKFWRSVVQTYSKTRAKDAKAVVTLSRASDQPGRIGMLKFLVPLLMDAFFHKACPIIFEPPIPGLIHNDKYRFHQVAVRKRWERVAQLSILGGIATLTWRLMKTVVQMIAVSSGKSPTTVTLGLMGSVAVAFGGFQRWKASQKIK